jgi:HEAT repeat protein
VSEGLKSNDKYVYAAAARLAGTLGRNASDTVPYLLPALKPTFRDIPMDFKLNPIHATLYYPWSKILEQKWASTFMYYSHSDDTHGARHEGYSCIISARLEAMRAIGKIGLPAANEAIPLLEEITKEDGPLPYHVVAKDILTNLKGSNTAN